MIAWGGLYAVIGLILFLILLYIVFWTLIYVLGIIGGLLVLAAGWGYTLCIILANAWRLPYLAVKFPLACLAYFTGRTTQAPRIADQWEYGVTPRAAFGLDCVLWLMIVGGPALLVWVYSGGLVAFLAWLEGPIQIPVCTLCWHG